MPLYLWVFLFALAGSVGSLIGGVILLWRQQWVLKYALWLMSFAAGALLGAALIDLLPEAIESAGGEPFPVVWYMLAGIGVFLAVERLLLHYHHGETHEERVHAFTWLLLAGDALHNFIDGMLIAGTFLVSFPLGVVTSLAVVAHELPQEIADFAVMLHGGWSPRKVLAANIATALTTLLGASLVLAFGQRLGESPAPLLAFVAGAFLYIANADLIPELHRSFERRSGLWQLALVALGVLVIWLTSEHVLLS
ncbi:MAG: ZIP family metal transporter [bacterium]|nr:ZIP family metal transporter [bacterium]MDZ4296677.1 ZIP family metal transporter [Patescibacteria group bacterium]